MQLNLKQKMLLIAGGHQTGKTYLVKYISRAYRCAVYSPYKEEWNDENVIYCESSDHVAEFPFWCDAIMKMAKANRINCAIFDDSDLLFRNFMDTSAQLRTLVTGYTHLNQKNGMTLIWITKRPQDIPPRIYGLCQVLALFPTESPQAIDMFNRIQEGLGDKVKAIPYGSYQFLLKEIGQEPKLSKV